MSANINFFEFFLGVDGGTEGLLVELVRWGFFGKGKV